MHARNYRDAGRMIARYNELKSILDFCNWQPGGEILISDYTKTEAVRFNVSEAFIAAIDEQVQAAKKKLADIGVEVD